MTPPVAQIKLYGERNTGTNFLEHLLRNNFTQPLLEGTANKQEKKQRRQMVKPLDGKLIAKIVKDRFDTRASNVRLLPEGLGWKHTSPPLKYLQSVPGRAAETLFLVLVKHPVFWSVSFLNRPYHSFFDYDGMTFSEFIRHPFVPTGRDNVEDPVYPSVVDLYAAKVDGYRKLIEMGVRHEIILYEQLIQDVGGFLARIGARHGLVRRYPDRDIVRDAATKNDIATLADYREKYRLDSVRSIVTPDDFDFIVQRFGTERLRWLGYSEA
ncbi:MAG: hypothetical protein JO056_08930 [Alphaproteobacteria bacterium]|nr:hypothetical protein [Alphaproteobacteria bacterium]